MAENHHSARVGPIARPLLRKLLAPLLLALLIAGMYWKLILTDEYTWLDSPDIANQVMPWFQYQAGEWHAGRIPLWEPYTWGGQPLIGQAQPGVAYPLNWVLFLAPLRHGWIRQASLHWYFVIIHILAAWFAYALCRDLKTTRTAAVLGGLAFSVSGYVGGVDWPQMLNAAVWIPLILLFLLRCVRGERPLRNSVLGGFFLGMAWLAGHHQVPIFTSLAAGGVWLWQIVRTRQRKMLLAAAAFFAVAIATGAVQTIPAVEYGKLARRWVGVDPPVGWNQAVPYKVHHEYSLNPSSLFGVVFPNQERFGHPYAGIALFSLCLIGYLMSKRRTEAHILASLAAAGVVLAMGGYTAIHGWLYALVPMVEKARSPNTALHLFGSSVAILAALGFDELLRQGVSAEWLRKAARWLAVFGGVVLLVLWGFKLAGKLDGDDRIFLTGLIALGLSGLLGALAGGRASRAQVTAGVLFLVVVELSSVLGYAWYNRYYKDRKPQFEPLAGHGDIAEFLATRPEPVRIVRDDGISYNFGDWYGIAEQGGYLASITSNLLNHQLGGDHVWRLFGVNYVIAKDSLRGHHTLLFQSRSGMKVYRNPDAGPRAFVVHEARQAQDNIDLAAQFDADSFDPLRTALFFKDQALPQLESCPGVSEQVRLAAWQPNRVRIEANLGCKGLIVLGDTYFPGWYATVDGRAAKVWEVDGLVRGVEVAAGAHVVEMRYSPRSVWLGAGLSLLGLMAACVAGLAKPKNSM